MECLPKKQQTVMEVEKKKNVLFKTYVIEMKLRPNEKKGGNLQLCRFHRFKAVTKT